MSFLYDPPNDDFMSNLAKPVLGAIALHQAQAAGCFKFAGTSETAGLFEDCNTVEFEEHVTQLVNNHGESGHSNTNALRLLIKEQASRIPF